MSQDRSFIASNAQALQRLKDLAARLTEAELAIELEGGWQVATDFAHLAFWDQRWLAQIEYWEQNGISDMACNSDILNRALLPVWQAIPPRAAVQLALNSAELIDNKLAGLSDEFLAAMRSLPNPPNLDRGKHRRDHLDRLERVLFS